MPTRYGMAFIVRLYFFCRCCVVFVVVVFPFFLHLVLSKRNNFQTEIFLPIVGNQTGTTNLGEGEPSNNRDNRVPHVPLIAQSVGALEYTDCTVGGGSYPSAEMQSVYSSSLS